MEFSAGQPTGQERAWTELYSLCVTKKDHMMSALSDHSRDPVPRQASNWNRPTRLLSCP